MFTVSMAFAQQKVTGVVIEAETGEPVVGASIRVKGVSNIGAATNIDGKFTLEVPSSSKTLIVSYIGMKTKEVAAKANMKIVLESDATTLKEQVVVAFGTSTKEAFTGSAAVVKSEDIAKHVTSNVANTLVGSVAGLQMRGSSGAPGAGTGSITIRGIASMYSNTDPLIIVDGAPYSASLTNINPNDVENISVLKDASSAALYGARGAAGVILVTTKKGSGKAKVNVDMKWGAATRGVQEYDVITDPNQFMEAYYSQFYNYAYYKNGLSNAEANKWVNERIFSDQNFGLKYNPYTVPDGEYVIGLNGKVNPNATLGRSYKASNGETYYITPDNWTDAAYHKGFRQEYNASVVGGTSEANYYSSFGYLNEDGIIDNSNYERFNARIKGEYQATKAIRLGANVSYVHSNTESNPNLSSSSLGSTNMMYYTSMIAPIYPLYVRVLDENGNPVIRTDSYGHKQYDFGVPASNYVDNGSRLFMATGNPLGSNQYNVVTNEVNQFNSTFTANVQITDWLKFVSTNNINVHFSNASDYENPFNGPTAGENGRLDKSTSYYLRQNYSQTLTFNKLFGDHSVQAMVGHEWYKNKVKDLEAIANGGFSPDIMELNAFANRYDSWSSNSTYNVEGWFGNALYNYQERYFASASYRRDASSRFHKNHRWGDFWSVGGAWIISKENFFQDLGADWVTSLKLKASIGQQGNDGVGDFRFLERYSLSKNVEDKAMDLSFAGIGVEDITWETTTNSNIGIEFGLFENRLTGSVEFYNKNVADQIFWLSIPESYGARGYYANAGDIRNTGIEVVLSGDIIRTQNIKWNVTANLSHNKTKILSLPADKIMGNGGFMESSSNIYNWYEVGKSLYNAAMPEFAGVNEYGEALYWVDKNIAEDSQVSNTSRPGKEHSYTTTDWTKASYYEQGSVLPKVQGGFSTTVELYGFDISATFDYQIGGKVYDYRYSSLMSPVSSKGNGATYHKDVFNSWTPNNTSTSIPRFQYQDLHTTAKSTRFLTNASYLNFQSFSVGYTLPAEISRMLSASKIRVYCQGENICFWSKRKGFDPRYSFLSNSTGGINTYSPSRTIMGGVQVSF